MKIEPQPKGQAYVLGFAFTSDFSKVMLMRKAKPEDQKGLLNGVGGKIEEGEDSHKAMVREFKEETGIQTNRFNWKMFCCLGGKHQINSEPFRVDCFVACIEDQILFAAINFNEEEPLTILTSNMIQNYGQILPNIAWLVPLAIDCARVVGGPDFVMAKYD